MDSAALLSELKDAGFSLRLDGETLIVNPRSRLTPVLFEKIAAHKAELLALLTPAPKPPPAVSYTYVTTPEGLADVVEAIRGCEHLAVDTETLGLNPRKHRVRLLQLATAEQTYVLDLFHLGDVSCLWSILNRAELIVHNGQFDLGMLWKLGFHPGKVYDLLLMSRLVTCGGPDAFANSLADQAKRYLGIVMDKTHQEDDWSVLDLTEEQKSYAALDARVTYDLYEHLQREIRLADLEEVAAIENEAVPAFVWLAASGVGFDSAAWERLAEEAERQCADYAARLDKLAPPPAAIPWDFNSPTQVREAFARQGIILERADAKTLTNLGSPLALKVLAYRKAVKAKDPQTKALAAELNKLVPPLPGEPWNWRSWQQVQKVFALLGVDIPKTDDKELVQVEKPPRAKEFATILRQHRSASHTLKHFARSWFDYVEDGRVYGLWNQLGTEAGRTSCEDPALQTVPNEAKYRRCFVAPPGYCIIKADYSQLHLRIAAKITGDAKMTEYLVAGKDLHTLTAQKVLKVLEVSKADRKLAKILNFGLLYGISPKSFRINTLCKHDDIVMTLEQAQQYQNDFFELYSGIRLWHRQIIHDHASETRSLLGRRCLMRPERWLGDRASIPVQGSDGDGAKRAMGLLWQRRHLCPDAFPILFLHDEIVLQCPIACVEEAKKWLHDCMYDAMAPILDPIPCVVDVIDLPTWSAE
jgi:DNA polymerase-1